LDCYVARKRSGVVHDVLHADLECRLRTVVLARRVGTSKCRQWTISKMSMQNVRNSCVAIQPDGMRLDSHGEGTTHLLRRMNPVVLADEVLC